MNDLMRKAIYRMRDEDETRKAEEQRAAALEHDAEFFAVNWDRYDDIPALPLEIILPLSVGINPSHRFAKIELAATYAGQATGAAAEKIAEMLKRRKKLLENLETEGGDVPVAVKEGTKPKKIKVSEFVAFAQKKGWELPEQLATTGSAASHAEAPETGKPTPRNDGRDTGKREGQIQAIEKAARDLGYLNPLEIPTGGRAAIKAHCFAWTEFGYSKYGFKRAWQEANKQGRICLAEKEKFMTK